MVVLWMVAFFSIFMWALYFFVEVPLGTRDTASTTNEAIDHLKDEMSRSIPKSDYDIIAQALSQNASTVELPTVAANSKANAATNARTRLMSGIAMGVLFVVLSIVGVTVYAVHKHVATNAGKRSFPGIHYPHIGDISILMLTSGLVVVVAETLFSVYVESKLKLVDKNKVKRGVLSALLKFT